MATFKHAEGRAVKLPIPQGVTVQQGTLAELHGFFGYVVRVKGSEAVLELGGHYETDQINTADAFNLGDPVYWDANAKVLTTSDGGGANRRVGRVTRAKDAVNTIGFVLTGGV